MTVCHSDLPYDFYEQRSLVVRFSELELSSDAGILLARQAEAQVQVCQEIAQCIQEWREPSKIVHSLNQLVSQRVYQLVGGYEDTNDSNRLRHDHSPQRKSSGCVNDLESAMPLALLVMVCWSGRLLTC